MSAPPTAEEDLRHIEVSLRKLFKVAMESLEAVEEILRSGRPADLSASAELAEHLKDTIYSEALFFIAKWQPLGHELIYVETLMKSSYDLFRIVRYANEIDLTISLAPGLTLPEAAEAAKRARMMLEVSFEALIDRDPRKAKKVEELDAEIDKAYREALRRVAENEQVPRREALACLILRQLERVADHATYIARDVARATPPR